MARPAEVLPGLWRGEARHPDWTPAEGDGDGWDPEVAWWATTTPHGLALIDPLVDGWDDLDRLVRTHGPCVGVVRTCHWHERSCTAAAARYGDAVWAAAPTPQADEDDLVPAPDHLLDDGALLWDAVVTFAMERDDEVAVWLPSQATLLFADAMIGARDGRLRVCPESWTMPAGGLDRLRAILRGLGRLPFEHVLVSHGPATHPDGRPEFDAALTAG